MRFSPQPVLLSLAGAFKHPTSMRVEATTMVEETTQIRSNPSSAMTGAFNWFVFTFFRRSWSQLSSHRHCEPKCSVYKRKLVLPKDGAWTSCQFWVTWWSMGKLLVGPCLPSLSLWLNDYHVCIRSAWDAEDIVSFGLIWMNQLLYSLRTDDSNRACPRFRGRIWKLSYPGKL